MLRQEICNMNRVRCRFSFYLIFLVLALFHLNSPILSPLSPLSLCIQHWRFTFSRTVPFVPGLLGIFSCVEYRKFSYFLLVVAPPTFMCFAWFFARLFPLSFPIPIYYHCNKFFFRSRSLSRCFSFPFSHWLQTIFPGKRIYLRIKCEQHGKWFHWYYAGIQFTRYFFNFFQL